MEEIKEDSNDELKKQVADIHKYIFNTLQQVEVPKKRLTRKQKVEIDILKAIEAEGIGLIKPESK